MNTTEIDVENGYEHNKVVINEEHGGAELKITGNACWTEKDGEYVGTHIEKDHATAIVDELRRLFNIP